MQLPIFQSSNSDLMLLETRWKSILDPVLALPQIQGQILQNIKLISGTNVINHGLGRKLQGWYITRKRQFLVTGTPTNYSVVDTQDQNQMPQLTLNLYSDQGTTINPVLVDIFVF